MKEEEIKEQLMSSSADFRRLAEEHHQYEDKASGAPKSLASERAGPPGGNEPQEEETTAKRSDELHGPEIQERTEPPAYIDACGEPGISSGSRSFHDCSRRIPISGSIGDSCRFGLSFGARSTAGLFVPHCLPLWHSFSGTRPRTIPGDPGTIVSPADGKVVRLERVGNVTQMSIFLSLFNVHVNRSPIAGRIEAVDYRPGKFLVAFNDKASTRERAEYRYGQRRTH